MTDWSERAACRDKPKDMFFPRGDPRSPSYQQTVRAAVAVCAECPVILACRAAGTGLEGIWGGEVHGAVRIRERVVKPCGTAAAYARHHRNGEPACRACIDALNIARAERADRQTA